MLVWLGGKADEDEGEREWSVCVCVCVDCGSGFWGRARGWRPAMATEMMIDASEGLPRSMIQLVPIVFRVHSHAGQQAAERCAEAVGASRGQFPRPLLPPHQ